MTVMLDHKTFTTYEIRPSQIDEVAMYIYDPEHDLILERIGKDCADERVMPPGVLLIRGKQLRKRMREEV